MTRRTSAAAVLLLALALSGCAPAATPGSTASTTIPAAGPSPSASPSADPSPSLVAPSPGSSAGSAATLRIVHGGSPALAGPRWTLVGRGAGGRSVTIQWIDAVSPSCGAVDEAVVTETADTVVVQLGRHAHAGHVLCPLVLALRSATIPLQQPLGDRTLLEPVVGGAGTRPTATCPPRTPGAVTGGASPRYACPLTPGG